MNDIESGFVEFPGTKIYYEVEGQGPPITLIHAGVAHLRMWDAQVAAWRERFRIVRYDERGFGLTITGDIPYSNAEDLRRVLDHVGVDKTHLLGTSRGGSIAMDFTLQNPDRVKSLILVAAGLNGYEVEEDPRLLAVWPEMERLEAEHEWDALVELETQIWTDGPGQPPERVDPEIRRQMIEWNLDNYRAAQVANQVQRPDVPAAQRLHEIQVPTLLVWGTFDETPVGKSNEKMAVDIAGARTHVFEEVAHMVSLERPAEFNALILDFLDGVEASA